MPGVTSDRSVSVRNRQYGRTASAMNRVSVARCCLNCPVVMFVFVFVFVFVVVVVVAVAVAFALIRVWRYYVVVMAMVCAGHECVWCMLLCVRDVRARICVCVHACVVNANVGFMCMRV